MWCLWGAKSCQGSPEKSAGRGREVRDIGMASQRPRCVYRLRKGGKLREERTAVDFHRRFGQWRCHQHDKRP
jgi:hypothetical protein